MTTLIKNAKTQPAVRGNYWAMLKITQASYRTYLYALISVVGMVVLIWAPFGIKRTVGLFEEWSTQRHPTSSAEFLVTHDPTRPFSYAPFAFAQSLVPNSFAGHNLFMMLLFVLKGIIVYKLIYRLMPKDRFLALITGCLFVIYPADTGLMTFRAINIHTSITFGLLAIYLMVAQWQEPKKWRYVGILILQFISLGIYEVMYGIIFSAPALLLWQEKRISRRLIRDSLTWWALPILMVIRAGYYIFSGHARYVNNQIDDGTAGNFSADIVMDSLSKVYERHFTAWGYAFDNMSRYSNFLVYSMLAGGIVALVAWQHWQKGEATKPKSSLKADWGRSLLLLLGGLLLIGISFAPYLITPYRGDTFRVFYLSSLGAALVVGVLIQWVSSFLRRYGKLPASAITGLLIMIATYNCIGQLAFFVKASDDVQRLLAGILMAAPKVPDNTIIVYVDETVQYQDEWHLAASTGALISALQYLYYDDFQHARFCTVAYERPRKYCVFRSDGIVHFDESGGITSIPYSQAVVIRPNYRGGFELLEEIPEEYILRGPAWNDNLDNYDPHGLIDEDGPLPERAFTFFTCWPVDDCLPAAPNTGPQSEVFLDFDTVMPGFGWEVPLYGRSVAWTTSPMSTLNLLLEQGKSYSVEFAIVYALDPSNLDSMALRVNGFEIPLQREFFEGGVSYKGLIPEEAVDANPDSTKLILSTDHVVSPMELGVGEDTRKLGVMVDWMRISPIRDVVRFEFDKTVPGSGWYAAESSMVWTSSTESTLDMWVNVNQPLTAEFRVAYFLDEEISNSLKFYANDVELPLEVTRDADGSAVYRTNIPLNVLQAGDSGMVHLKFIVNGLSNPAALGINGDTRDLGLLFDWLELRPTTAR